MKTVHVGIIGTGSISAYHMEGYLRLEGVKVVAVCDCNLQRAEKFAQKYGVPHVFDDYKELLKLDEIQAVSITTWNNYHAQISIDSLSAGKDVLCEKPIAMNAEEAKQMIEAAQKTGHLLMVGFVRRFGQNTKIVKDFIDKGILGDIYYAKISYMRRWGNPGGWFSDQSRSGGGPVIDLGVHIIDLVWYLSGKPRASSVYASTFHKLGLRPELKGIAKYNSSDYSEYNDVEDCAAAMIKFENGMTVFFETSWVLNVKEDVVQLQLFGDKAGVQMEPVFELYETKENYMVNTLPVLTQDDNSFVNNFNEEIQHFVDCVREKKDSMNPGEDGLRIMEIISAIYESARTGHEVLIK